LRDKESIHRTFYYAIIILMMFGLAAVAGLSLMPGMATIQGNRLQSFLQYANTTALFMGIGVLFSVDFYLTTRKKRYAVWGALFFTALLLTQSRTTFVLFIIVMMIYMARKLRFKAMITWFSLVAGLVFGLIMLGGRLARVSIFEPT